MNIRDFESCSECGRKIPRSEQAYVFEGNIVCQECDNILRNGLSIERENQKLTEQEVLNLSALHRDQDYSEEERQVIKLPSFLRSCYLETSISSDHSSLIGGHNGLRSFITVLFLGGIAAIAVLLLIIYLF